LAQALIALAEAEAQAEAEAEAEAEQGEPKEPGRSNGRRPRAGGQSVRRDAS
jgi:regulator of protease activity HflC (stomatin/prohibitin superfamily)